MYKGPMDKDNGVGGGLNMGRVGREGESNEGKSRTTVTELQQKIFFKSLGLLNRRNGAMLFLQ